MCVSKLSVCVHESVYICIRTYVGASVCVHVFLIVCVCVCVCMCVCMCVRCKQIETVWRGML